MFTGSILYFIGSIALPKIPYKVELDHILPTKKTRSQSEPAAKSLKVSTTIAKCTPKLPLELHFLPAASLNLMTASSYRAESTSMQIAQICLDCGFCLSPSQTRAPRRAIMRHDINDLVYSARIEGTAAFDWRPSSTVSTRPR